MKVKKKKKSKDRNDSLDTFKYVRERSIICGVSGITQTVHVETHLQTIQTYTCIRFKDRGNETDYVFLRPVPDSEGCYSAIGRNRGRQDLGLARDCVYVGIVMHELLHSLGFVHEQSRLSIVPWSFQTRSRHLCPH